MSNPIGNSAVQIHDSILERIIEINCELIFHFDPCLVHYSEGIPGRDPGTVWTQKVLMTLRNFTLQTELPRIQLPEYLDSGFIISVKISRNELIPIPYHENGDLSLFLMFELGQEIHVKADEIQIIPMPDPKFHHDFTPIFF